MPIVVVDAPSNLGLRPPSPGSVPGCYKAGWALRNAGLLNGLDAQGVGTVVPPRYEPTSNPKIEHHNTHAIQEYSRRLAAYLDPLLTGTKKILVIGGDCSILLGESLALRRRGRFGLIFVDGHSDFSHPGNSSSIDMVAAMDLALITGRGDRDLANIDNLAPYIFDHDVAVIGIREGDETIDELRSLSMQLWSVTDYRRSGVESVQGSILDQFDDMNLEGFWIHLDVDVLDPDLMPAVDSPSPGGFTFAELEHLLYALLPHPKAVGIDVCIYDPDRDVERVYAHQLSLALRGPLAAASRGA